MSVDLSLDVASSLVRDTYLPRFFKAKQIFPRPKIEKTDIPEVIVKEMSKPEILSKIKPGMRIAITCGSRGVASYVITVKTLVAFLKDKGAEPFIVPAMGSHGGANAENQTAILNHYGITEESVGCPIVSSMEVVEIGLTYDGRDVYIDKNAAEADGIILYNRIKPHTCFRGPYESGLHKMCAIGLAKQAGAENCHEQGYEVLGDNVFLFGQGIINNSNVICGLGVVENAFDELCIINAIEKDKIKEEEPKLLEKAKSLMPSLLVGECDVLVVDEIGKNFSGDGMDPNITGTFCTPYASGGIKSQYVTVLGLSPETIGNGIGVGMADVTTKRCADELDLGDMYPNSITSVELGSARIPVIMKSDKEAIQVCTKICIGIDRKNPRIVRIPNSSFVQHILLSEAYLEEVKNRNDMEVESELFYLPFDDDGNLMDLEPRVRSNDE